MRRFPSSFSDPEDQSLWIPNTDVYIAEDGNLIIEVELAGMKREDVELSIEGSRLGIRGKRPDDGRRQRCQYLVSEFNYGPFENVIELPPGYDLSAAKAACQNGILRIDVARKK